MQAALPGLCKECVTLHKQITISPWMVINLHFHWYHLVEVTEINKLNNTRGDVAIEKQKVGREGTGAALAGYIKEAQTGFRPAPTSGVLGNVKKRQTHSSPKCPSRLLSFCACSAQWPVRLAVSIKKLWVLPEGSTANGSLRVHKQVVGDKVFRNQMDFFLGRVNLDWMVCVWHGWASILW